jgi:hypothetical protein
VPQLLMLELPKQAVLNSRLTWWVPHLGHDTCLSSELESSISHFKTTIAFFTLVFINWHGQPPFDFLY